jgi:hypothetical protein
MNQVARTSESRSYFVQDSNGIHKRTTTVSVDPQNALYDPSTLAIPVRDIASLVDCCVVLTDVAQPLKRAKVKPEKSAGKGWFDMRASSSVGRDSAQRDDEELQRDLQVIKLRNYLDPKRFYKARACMFVSSSYTAE